MFCSVRVASRRHIPRGCQTEYIPGLTDESKSLYEAYKFKYSRSPFDDGTIGIKPVNDSAIPKSYRPISLLCHSYKLYERLILNRIAPTIEQQLIKEQAGSRPGKSCTSQLLNITQHIEDGYKESMITGTAFVDLSAAYDTVNHRLLIQKHNARQHTM